MKLWWNLGALLFSAVFLILKCFKHILFPSIGAALIPVDISLHFQLKAAKLCVGYTEDSGSYKPIMEILPSFLPPSIPSFLPSLQR
jgi:hypothetical protein